MKKKKATMKEILTGNAMGCFNTRKCMSTWHIDYSKKRIEQELACMHACMLTWSTTDEDVIGEMKGCLDTGAGRQPREKKQV